jgi:hypothetical protein
VDPAPVSLKPEARAEGMGFGSSNADSLSLRFGLCSKWGGGKRFVGALSGPHVLAPKPEPQAEGCLQTV